MRSLQGSKLQRSARVLVIALVLTLGVSGAVAAAPGISPATVEALVYPSESITLNKTVTTPAIPPKLDVCFLQDETGSFYDDIGNLNAAAPGIFDSITATAPDSQFAVAGFRDYPVDGYGSPGDWVYRLISPMDPNKPAWLAGVAALTAGGGLDEPEAQYDAIVAASGPGSFDDPTLGLQGNCGWRDDPLVTRVLVVVVDSPFHTPDGTHMNGGASTIAALLAQNIRLIGLKAPGSGSELDALAAATGGSVQPLSSNSDNITAAILTGLSNLPVEVSMASDCADPIGTTFVPASQTVTSGTDAVFAETVSVAAGAAGGDYTCKDWALINGQPMTDANGATIYENKTIHVPGIDLEPKTGTNELGFDLSHTVIATVTAGSYGPVAGVRVEFEILSGPNAGLTGVGVTDSSGQASFTYTPPVNPAHLGTDTIQACFTNPGGTVVYGCDTAEKTWQDTTPPSSACLPTVNPAGKTVPNAPGKGGQGQNQDGFYQISGHDVVWPDADLEVYVTDSGSGTVFGPFDVYTRIKYTQAPDATPSIKPIGGPASAVAWHIIGTGDAVVTVVDGSGNVSTGAACLVPPPPK
jgi:hypothetical protein